MMPDGIGIIPLFIGFQRGTADEFKQAMQAYETRVAELAAHEVDLIHPEGAPPFMVQGFKGEQRIIRTWERKYKVPMVTAGMTQVEALKALKSKKVLGVTYFTGAINNTFAKYFEEAGFEVLAMEGIPVAFEDVGRLASQEVYAHTRRAFLKHKTTGRTTNKVKSVRKGRLGTLTPVRYLECLCKASLQLKTSHRMSRPFLKYPIIQLHRVSAEGSCEGADTGIISGMMLWGLPQPCTRSTGFLENDG